MVRNENVEETMTNRVNLVAAIYPDFAHGKVTFDMLHTMHRAVTVTVIDSALITKSEDGKVKVEETTELTTGKGARRGAVITGVLGLIYPPSLIASILVGGGLGGLIGKLRDTGIKNPQIKDIADRLEPGKSAVIALADEESTPDVQRALAGYEGRLVVQPIDDETMKHIYEAAESDE